MILEQLEERAALGAGFPLAAPVRRYFRQESSLHRLIPRTQLLVSLMTVVVVWLCFKASGALAFEPLLRLDHVTILTSNLDSLTRSFLKKGYTITWGEGRGLVRSNYVFLADSSYIELQTTFARDTLDWRVRQLRDFGTHVSAIAFRTRELDSVATLLSDSVTLQGAAGRSITLGGYPIDVTISERPGPLPPRRSEHPNGSYKMDWLLPSADEGTVQMFAEKFRLLSIPKSHEGCCDYWKFGPPEARTRLRFDKLYVSKPPKGDYLLMEFGGIVVGYH